MKKPSLLVLILLLTLAWVAILNDLEVKAEPQTIVVPDDYLSIFDAMENVSDGDTIFVKSGDYEGPINQSLIINKAISIIGENPETTTLFLHPEWITKIIITTPLSYYAEPITIEASNVTISGLTINSDGGAIGAKGDKTIITGNILRVNIAFRGSHQLFTENTLIGTNAFCQGTYTSMTKNTVYDGVIGSDSGSYDKIFANNVTGSIGIGGTSNYELVYDNIVKDGSDLYWAGIFIASIGTTVTNNTISNCSIGISQDWGSNNKVIGNVITNNRGPALKVTAGSNFSFVQNYVADNPVGMQIDTTFAIYQNSFVNNNIQLEILDEKIYFWSMDNGDIGNYWSDYTGKDADGDGIGDLPYIVDKQILDNYPLMELTIIPENNLTLFGFLSLVIILSVVKLAYKKRDKGFCREP